MLYQSIVFAVLKWNTILIYMCIFRALVALYDFVMLCELIIKIKLILCPEIWLHECTMKWDN